VAASLRSAPHRYAYLSGVPRPAGRAAGPETRAAVDFAVRRRAPALGCTIHWALVLRAKNYFYPGPAQELHIFADNELSADRHRRLVAAKSDYWRQTTTFRITALSTWKEDAGSWLHKASSIPSSRRIYDVDLHRAGTPLILYRPLSRTHSG